MHTGTKTASPFNIHSGIAIQKKKSPFTKVLPAVPVFQWTEKDNENTVLQPTNLPIQVKTKEEDELQMKKQDVAELFNPLQKKENNTGMPDNLKTGIENLSGISMGDVNVHYNSDKPAQLNALAYAQGADIHIASGQEKHLPHEAWHVVQQKQGRVKATTQMKGVAVNDDKVMEKEADMMGKKAFNNRQGYKPHTKNISNTLLVKQFRYTDAVMQFRLKDLTSEKVIEMNETDKNYNKEYLPLLTALKEYENVPDEEFDDVCKALDHVSAECKKLRDLFDNYVYNENKSELDASLTKLYDFDSELKREVKALVQNLPMDKLQKSNFNPKGKFAGVIDELWENEPELDETVPVETTTGKKLDIKTAYMPARGKPFIGEPQVEDVKQGFVGDCWIMAPLISLVNTTEGKKKIKEIVQPNDKESAIYTVTMYEPGNGEGEDVKYDEIKIDVISRFPSSKGKFVFALEGFAIPSEESTVALWPAIIEKAFAKSPINKKEGKNYLGLEPGQGASTTFSSVLGKPAGGDVIDKQKIIELISQQKAVTVSTDTHYYSVIRADADSIVLRNPHGKDEFYNWEQLQIKFRHYNTDAKIGIW